MRQLSRFILARIDQGTDAILGSDFFQNAALVVFDQDGVLAHTERFQFEAFYSTIKFFSPGVSLSVDDLINEFIGKTPQYILSTLKERHSIDATIEELLAARAGFFLQHVRDDNLQPNPHILPLLEDLQRRGIPVIVLTNGTGDVQDEVLKQCDLTHYFDAGTVISADRREIADKVAWIKAYAASRGIQLDRVVLFEDSPGTCAAARGAGIHAVHCVHECNHPIEDFPSLPCTSGKPSRADARNVIALAHKVQLEAKEFG